VRSGMGSNLVRGIFGRIHDRPLRPGRQGTRNPRTRYNPHHFKTQSELIPGERDVGLTGGGSRGMIPGRDYSDTRMSVRIVTIARIRPGARAVAWGGRVPD